MKKTTLCLLASGCLIFSCRRAFTSQLTAIWANDGEDKVTRDELRASKGAKVTNLVWDGSKVTIFGGRNEVVAFNIILEAAGAGAGNVTVTFDTLTGPNGNAISSAGTTGNGVFDWTKRNIELFYVRYLQINGLSLVSYPTNVDERQVPKRLQRPWSGRGVASGGWTDRPDHNKFYPEIAVPIELVPSFSIAGGSNQSIWVDIYIPKTATPGLYRGALKVQAGGAIVGNIPVQLQVFNFTLPDVPASKTMLYYSSADVNRRFFGNTYVNPSTAEGAKALQIRDRFFMLVHRHGISLIGDNPGDDCSPPGDQPCPEWTPRLDGSLFTAANGYNGPGVNTGNNVYSVGTYGSWSWKSGTHADMNTHTNAWANWMSQYAPSADYFLYLADESANYAQTENWSQWILSNPGVGSKMRSMATVDLQMATAHTPSLDIPASTFWTGVASIWEPLVAKLNNDPRKRFYMYNGHRPASGSFATEDDGIALRELAWGQYKKKINRWFFWQSTYYNNNQGGTGETDVFKTAQTFGAKSNADAALGLTGWNFANGDGVMLYPGTDKVFPSSSYGVEGPFASLRLKYWRRGIQDVAYLNLAAGVNGSATQDIVNKMVPKALWEYDVDNASDPSYVHAPISWSSDPDVWEAARAQLANMIAGSPRSPGSGLPSPTLNLPTSLPVTADITAGYPTGYDITSFEWSFVPAIQVAAARRASRALPTVNYARAGQTVSLTTQNLSPGQYVISVAAVDSSNNISPAAQADVTLVGLASADFSNLRAYPNPWRSDQGYPHQITFDHLPAGAVVQVFTVSGHLIKTISASGDTAVWDLTNDSGDSAAAGIYMYSVKANDGQSVRGKLALLH